jgi:hypothetical protein
MLPSRPIFARRMNVFQEVWIAHKSLGLSSIISRGQTPRFHTAGFVQGIEPEFDEHKKTTTMFQQATE